MYSLLYSWHSQNRLASATREEQHHKLPFAGKTTLLDLLAGRKTSGRLAPGSEILFNGRPPSSALLRRDGACFAAQQRQRHLVSPAALSACRACIPTERAQVPLPPFTACAVGYVEQHDTLLPLLTPFEMLLYTAELKQPRATPRAMKRRLVAALIDK